jgi:hypothetical protein
MDTLQSIPDWVIYAAVGAIFGAAGALVGWLLERATGWKFWRVMMLVGIALTPTVTREFVIPELMGYFMNRDLPQKVDEVTTLTHVTLDGRHYVYTYDLADSVSAELTADDVRQAVQSGACGHFAPLFRSGEVRSVSYVYHVHGSVLSFDLNPGDC